ncbi:MAG: cytochrome P450 [Flavobacteriaceae bacterium]
MKQLPHVSVLKVLANRKAILKNPLHFHKENFEKLGDTFRISIPGEGKVVFSRDPDLIKQVLQKKHRFYSKSKLQTKDLAKYIGKGLLTSEGEHWRTHRRMIQPAFHAQKLRNLFGIMKSAIVEELERIKPNTDQDAFALMGDLAFQVVAKSLFSSNDIREPMSRLQHITEENQKMLIREMRQPYFKWWFKVSGKINRYLDMGKQGRSILNKLIEERLANRKEDNDLLDMLLDATYEDGTKMSRKQLIDEVLILFTAGHETTANALAFTLYFLAKDEKLQVQLFEEVSSLGSGDYTWEDLGKLKLVMSCVKESMRLYPPVYIIDRVALEENTIHGLELKKGTLVLLSLFELHKHKDFWDSPEKYTPHRFVDIDMKEASNYYYPFGAGPRMCIGNAFATYEMTMAVVELVRKYRISTKMGEVEINPMISLKPKEVILQFSPR